MVVCGGCVSLLFDFFRSLRIVLKPPAVVTALSDVIFSATATFFAIACVWNLNNGIFRAYEFIGLVLGIILYFLLLSKWILKFFLLIIGNILKFVKLISKILLTPSLFLYKILIAPLCKSINNMIQRSRAAYVK
ncbi:MAG: spore cortex biosynthesis protein YabQ, partial [Oscillospiraceae bacterium]|nr:spore cortex biosynthesis protein YabQ [Oscillospiraceae bacterium]